MSLGISETQTHSYFAEPVTAARLEAVARALEANGFVAQLVATAEEAKLAVLDLLPLGCEVHTGASATLETLGQPEEFESGRYDPVRPKYLKLDRQPRCPSCASSCQRRSSCWPAPAQLRSLAGRNALPQAGR